VPFASDGIVAGHQWEDRLGHVWLAGVQGCPYDARVSIDDLQPASNSIEPALPSEPADVERFVEEDVEHYRFRIGKNLTRRIDQYLKDRVSYLSRASVQRLIGEGLVKANGRVIKASYRPREGDIVEMVAPPKPISELVPEPIPLDVVYEDDHFMAINKQADIMVHPARGRWTGTLVNALVYYGQKWSTVGGEWRPGILHRLDRNTTGIMLIAKSDEAHWRLARQFENRTIQKSYMAVCHGVPELLADVIDLPIGQDRYMREKQAIRKIEKGGKPAVTLYEVQELFEAPADLLLHESDHAQDRKSPPPPARFSLIKLTPKTGRTHQLRVHMSIIGHPMVGDTMYGGRILERDGFRFARQALHARAITFVHPVTLQTMTLQAPLPPDMEQLVSVLRG
jgi:23S rRNA pseudouridine1911/1915/1917 synthase